MSNMPHHNSFNDAHRAEATMWAAFVAGDGLFDPYKVVTSNLEVALNYAKAGISVFPCKSAPWIKGEDKRPIGVRSWTKESTTDETTIRAWWRKYSDALVAIDCGKSGLVVIDADRHEGPDGVAAFDDLVDANGGLTGYSPLTLTASNGQHHFFLQPTDGKPLGNSEGELKGRGINVRGAGGYVIAQGSMREDCESGWLLAGSPYPGVAEAYAAGTIPVIPQWLVELIRAPKERDDAPEQPEPDSEAENPASGVEQLLGDQRAPAPSLSLNERQQRRARAWAEKALDDETKKLAAAIRGGRNNQLNDSAFAMGQIAAHAQIAAHGLMTRTEVWSALQGASRANGYIADKKMKAFNDTFNSGFPDGRSNPRKTPDFSKDEGSEYDREIELLADDIGRRVDEAYASRKIEEAEDGTLYDAQTGEVIEAQPSGAPSKRESASKEPDIKPTPYEWLDPSSIPPREWLFGYHYIRGFIGVTGASGGVGKSQLTIAEALSMVSGRALLCGTEPTEILNVWIWNGEDPMPELERRIAGTAKHYGIKREDCRGQLFVDSGRNTKIVIAKAEKGGLVIARPLVEALKQRLAEDKIDVLIIDPFVKSHRVSENDNTLIDAVASEWADIAEQTNCAIELVHHVRKIGDVEVTVEAMRGASALVSAARSARVLNPMTDDEAKKAGVDNRRAYFRVNNGKSNMAPSSENATWFHLQSVDLQNRGPYEDGDSVGVVTDWKWPDPTEGVTVDNLRAAQAAIADGQWREDVRAKNWAGLAVADALGLDPDDKQAKEKIKGLLKIWIKNGALVVVDGKDEASRTRKFVMCGRDADDETFDPSAY